MHTIGEVSQLTGISAYTLRYYEKIGVLPAPGRSTGGRRYEDKDVQYIRFIHGLKETGMSLEDIAAFTESGCLLSLDPEAVNLDEILDMRIGFLNRHIEKIERQVQELERIRLLAVEKRDYYKLIQQKPSV